MPEERRVVLLRRHPEVLDLVRPRVHLHRAPAEVEPELEGAASVDPVVVEVREADARRHRGEVPVPEGRGQPLGEREVRGAAGADLPGRPRLGPAPLLRVVAVLGLVDERRPLAFRVEAPAHVLDRDGVAPLREVDAVLHARLDVVAVRRADQDDREGARPVRQVHVGRELHAVAHRHPDAEQRADATERASGTCVVTVGGMASPGSGVRDARQGAQSARDASTAREGTAGNNPSMARRRRTERPAPRPARWRAWRRASLTRRR